MKIICLGILLFLSYYGYSQITIGDGNRSVVIATSDNADFTHGDNVMNGKGKYANKFEAARFLTQAALGYTLEDIHQLSDGNYEAWIDQQTSIPPTKLLPLVREIHAKAKALQKENKPEKKFRDRPRAIDFHYAWWQNTQYGADQLRQRIAFALSEIFVISSQSSLERHGVGLADFYDVLSEGAFGNYRDLLFNVALHPTMGFYLSHLNNKKTTTKTQPDENFAREIMQLFSIGLHELNNDGTTKLDKQGNTIPTYDQSDIKNFAKVFTGLKGGAWSRYWKQEPEPLPSFGKGIEKISLTTSMIPDESKHEKGTKYLLYGESTNGNTMEDINAAINNLYHHPNVGPFIGKQLIQRLVKSNPTPEYIERVANAFNNTNGVRGDMKAVIKAILLDPEAREASFRLANHSGKFREPLMKYVQVVSMLDKDNPVGDFWNNSYSFYDATAQMALRSPSVFNFYSPNFKPVELGGMYAPEVQIYNTRTAINWINEVHHWTFWLTLFWDWEDEYTPNVMVDYTNYVKWIQEQEEEFLNHIDLIFTSGTLTDFTRSEIRKALDQLENPVFKSMMTIFLVLVSPEYSVLH